MKHLLCLLFLLPALLEANDAFPTARRNGLPSSDWRTVGVPGGHPSVTTVFTTLAAGSSAATINAAIAACPSNQVVKLDAGTYTLTANITLNKDGVVLRGTTNANGFSTTLFNSAIVKMQRSAWPSANSWVDILAQAVSSGLTEGSTSITLSAPANSQFVVGDLFIIDQLFDGTNVKDDSVDFAHRPNRPYLHVAQCTSIAGAVVGFTPPLTGIYWSGAQTPQAFGWSVLQGSTLKAAGFEDIDIRTAGSGTQVIEYGPAYGCWVKNARITDWPTGGGASGIRLAFSACCEIYDSIFHDNAVVTSSSYAIYPTTVSYCAIENNIFTNLALAMPIVSATGCSFSYNYCTGPYPYSPAAFFAEYLFPHGGHSYSTLYEANWHDGPWVADDIFNGNNSTVALVRNRIVGSYPGKSVASPVAMNTDMRNITFLGNALGLTGAQNNYETTYPRIFAIDPSCTGTIRTNNYNTVTAGIPAGEAISASDTVANSYRFASKPAFFAGMNFPPLGPSATYANNQQAYTNLPAGYRSKFGIWPSGAPTAVSATVLSNGSNVVMTFSAALTAGAGGSGGMNLSMSAGAATMAYLSGSGSASITFTTSRLINYYEFGTAGYTQPGNGWEDSGGVDLPSFSGIPVLNNAASTNSSPRNLRIRSN